MFHFPVTKVSALVGGVFTPQALTHPQSRVARHSLPLPAWVSAPGSLSRRRGKTRRWLSYRCISAVQVPDAEQVGPFICCSGPSLCMSEKEGRLLFAGNEIFWAHGVTFSIHFDPEGPWGRASVAAVSWLWIVSLWALTSRESQSPDAPGLGRKLDSLCKQFWRVSPWSKWLAHSVAYQCFRLQIVNHEVHIDLSRAPFYWLIFNRCSLLSLSLRKVSSMKKEAAWLNWKSKGLMLDLRGSTTYQLHEPGANFFGKWKIWSQ